MELPENLNMYAAAALFAIGAYLVATYFGLLVWTFRDIRARTRDVLGQILSVLLVAIFTLPGVLIYILLRPKETLSEEYDRSLAEEAVLQDLRDRRVCPNCHRRVEPSYVLCPHCEHQLRLKCVSCGELLEPDWQICPYCGHRHENHESQEKVERKPRHLRRGDVAAEPSTEPEAEEIPEGKIR
ncbi:MAG: zinc ribbon domain-containing protein [Chloroflexi bacterium]|nr:zinc ribbon domain-containing protein [Chloroflexota bacterium]